MIIVDATDSKAPLGGSCNDGGISSDRVACERESVVAVESVAPVPKAQMPPLLSVAFHNLGKVESGLTGTKVFPEQLFPPR